MCDTHVHMFNMCVYVHMCGMWCNRPIQVGGATFRTHTRTRTHDHNHNNNDKNNDASHNTNISIISNAIPIIRWGGFFYPPLVQSHRLVRGTPLQIDVGSLLSRMIDEQMSSADLRSTSRYTNHKEQQHTQQPHQHQQQPQQCMFRISCVCRT